MLSKISVLFKYSNVGIRYIPICNHSFRSFTTDFKTPAGKKQNVKQDYQDTNLGRASTEDTNISLDEQYKSGIDLKPQRDDPLGNLNIGIDQTKPKEAQNDYQANKTRESFADKDQINQAAADAWNEGKKKAQHTWDAAQDSAKYVAEKVSSVDRNAIRDKLRDTARDAAKETQNAYEGAKDAFEGAKETISTKAEDAYNAAQDTYNAAKEDLSSAANKAKENLKDAFDDSANQNEPELSATQKLWEQAKETASNITTEAGHIAEKVKDTIKEKIGLADDANKTKQDFDANQQNANDTDERIVDKFAHSAKDAAQSAKETLKDAAASVKETAKDAAESVKETARKMTGRKD